jgi:Protein of unknown function (DUF3176)
MSAKLNAIISFLGAMVRGSLVLAVASVIGQSKWLRLGRERECHLDTIQAFDDASRGPFGAFALLISRQSR